MNSKHQNQSDSAQQRGQRAVAAAVVSVKSASSTDNNSSTVAAMSVMKTTSAAATGKAGKSRAAGAKAVLPKKSKEAAQPSPATHGSVVDAKVQQWSIAALKANLLQAKYFELESSAKIRALADDIAKHGLRQPIEILPNGRILDGHCRFAAIKLLGWTLVPVRVRNDLADATPSTIECEYLKYNFLRRQLSPLEQARIARRFLEIEKHRAPGELRLDEASEARDRVGAILGMSGRNIQRYCNLLDAPLEVQRAVDHDKLRLTDGAQVKFLPRNTQQEIAAALRKKESSAQAIVEKFLREKGDRPHPSSAFSRLCAHLRVDVRNVGDQFDALSALLVVDRVPLLTEAGTLIQKLLTKAQDAPAESQRECDELAEMFNPLDAKNKRKQAKKKPNVTAAEKLQAMSSKIAELNAVSRGTRPARPGARGNGRGGVGAGEHAQE